MSGRAMVQQGRATTCQDPTPEGPPRRGEDGGLTHEPVGAMQEASELLRGPRRTPRCWVTPKAGPRGSGHSVVLSTSSGPQTQCWDRVRGHVGTRVQINGPRMGWMGASH